MSILKCKYVQGKSVKEKQSCYPYRTLPEQTFKNQHKNDLLIKFSKMVSIKCATYFLLNIFNKIIQ